MGWGDQGRQHQTRMNPSQSMTIPGLPHVRCASRTSFRRFPWHVRLPSKTRRESGHSGSAGLCQKRSLDHLVVACEFRRQHFEAERPLTTAFGKAILAEFIYGGKVTPTLPLNPAKEHWVGWWIKVTGLPLMYWNYMLKGHVWFPKHNTAFKGDVV